MPVIEFTDRGAVAQAPQATRALARAAVAARRAPSVLNSQSWRWRIADTTAQLRADRERQLTTIDPGGRLLTVSCGAALHHFRTALAGTGTLAEVTRLPDPADPDLLAVVRVTGFAAAEPAAVRRQQAMALRRTDRRPFADIDVADEALERLRAEAEENGGHLHLLRPDDVVTLAVAADRAATVEFADPAYRAELADWTTRAADGDGVSAATAGHRLPRPVPVRDLAPGVRAGSAAGTELVDRRARYALLFTDADDPQAWLRAGEALSALLLAATMERLAVSPLSDVVEVPAARRLLHDLLGGVGYPMLALRVGVPEDSRPPAANRRPATQTVDIAEPERGAS